MSRDKTLNTDRDSNHAVHSSEVKPQSTVGEVKEDFRKPSPSPFGPFNPYLPFCMANGVNPLPQMFPWFFGRPPPTGAAGWPTPYIWISTTGVFNTIKICVQMAASIANTDVIVDVGSAEVPSCPHGPALLFERYTKRNGSRQFYACSAFRDHKQCSFFRWADDMKSCKVANKASVNGSADVSTSHPLSHSAYRKRFLKFKKQPLSKRSLCCTCGLLLLVDEVKEHEEKGHQIKRRIRRAVLQHPTTLFDPQEDNKTYAQYLFADSAVNFIMNCLENLKDKTHVLCVGAPRLHETITLLKKQRQTKMTSLLLDLDSRYAQLYSSKKLCRYNMFNHHFFDPQGEDHFKSFLREGGPGLVMVTDPPFGGMVEPLAATFKKIEDTWRSEVKTDVPLPILWFFPYFMEKRVCECLPSLVMLDYKVDYDNHNLFQSQAGKRKKGSPVRIFTNIPPLALPLPPSEGYWFCEECQRFSAPENQHCLKCNSCTSKDGTTYQHCDPCQRCVKATRVHCQACGVCDLPNHVCGQPRGEGCHVCGALDHKRRDCPQRHSSNPRHCQGKRSAKRQPGRLKKKQRTQ